MSLGRRMEVTARVLAAIVGGYVATALAAVALARLLPLSKAEATHAATLLSFAVYVGIVLAVFHASTVLRAWLLPVVVGAVAASVSLLAGAGS